jgi:surface protein
MCKKIYMNLLRTVIFTSLMMMVPSVCAHPSDRTFTSRSSLRNAILACATNNWETDDCILNMWDVSQVTDMSTLFMNQNTFNEDISSWDVSSVTNMRNMFERASLFNQPLDSWDVSSVTDMRYMFSYASAFNQPLANWNVSSVTEMDDMFSYASAFNKPLNSWDVSSVTDMRYMFYSASSFNRTLSCWNFNSGVNIQNIFYSSPAKELFHFVVSNTFTPSLTEIPHQGNKGCDVKTPTDQEHLRDMIA